MPIKAHLLFSTVLLFLVKAANGQQETESRPAEGASCSTADPKWYSVEQNPYDFLYCHMENKVFTRQRCSSSFNGEQKIFDQVAQQCVIPEGTGWAKSNGTGLFADSGDSIFGSGPRTGDPCQADADCPQNGRCATKGTCECQTSYLDVQRLCWSTLAPTDGPCMIDEQCSSSWPGAECYRGTCICPRGTVPVNTLGGILCSGPDKCPLGGPHVVVSEPLDGADPCQSCDEANFASSPSSFLYECVKGAGFSRPICCPNKAKTCMQPQLSGNGQLNVTRFSYNSRTDECQEFEFYGGTMVNSNVFHTKTQCENYCRKGCLRGTPEIKNGQTVSCTNEDQCGSSFRCYKRDGAEPGLCCPAAESICSPFGGIGLAWISGANDAPIKEFDAGADPEKAIAIYYPAVRYYYSASEKQCKTFLYRGVGGNFNNFLTMEQCLNFCATAVCNSGTAAINNKTKRWIRCRLDEQCPPNFTCQNGSCCAGNKTKKASSDFTDQACPRGTRVALRESGEVIFCDSANSCPEDAFCRVSITSADGGEGICCAGHLLEFQSPKCPGNGSVPMVADKFQSATCSLGQQMGCPPPYTCAYVSINATDGLCCMVPPEAVVCPSGMEKVMTEDGRHHQQCSPLHLSTCPEGGACVFNEAYGVYYCCRAAERDCPEGRTPYTDPYSSKTLNCSSNCPAGFACLDSPGPTRKRTCCSEHPLAKHCLVGKALTNRAGVPYSCGADSKCPPGYYCVPTPGEGGVCCPRSDHVCSLSVDFGSACAPGLETVSFYFNPTDKTCKPFRYRGCGGNSNRFADFDQCDAFCHLSEICRHGQPAAAENSALKRQHDDGTISCAESAQCPDGYNCTQTARNQSYCCPAPEAVCNQPKSSGFPCDDLIRDVNAYQRVWYFDVDLKKCQPMSYYGCEGNANRFHTLEACEQFCYATVCPAGGSPLTSERGLQQCWKDDDCRSGYQCMTDSGKPSVCCPSPETMCLSPIDKGEACGVPQVRYGFDRTSSTCMHFTYSGCEGNDNNFRSLDACKNTCSAITGAARSNALSTICPDPSHVDYDRPDEPLRRCATSDDCPLMHLCTFPNSNGPGLGYCCPMPKQKCLTQPPLWSSQKYPSNDECWVHIASTCPANYSCQLTEAGHRKCCLDPDVSRVCRASTLPGTVGHYPLKRCDESDDQCAPGFSCVYNRQFGQFFCCLDTEQQTRTVASSTDGDDLLCPGGVSTYVDPYLNTVRVCSPYLRFSCPTSYECVYNARAARYQCCFVRDGAAPYVVSRPGFP